MSPSDKKQATFIVSGKVQGVAFRAYAEEEASLLCLTGYARNLPSGEVEVLVQGDEEKIQNFIAWAKKGSRSARVEKVEVKWSELTQAYEDFSIY
jgi:acylphosphatase